jgi:acid phosphatase (class A)
MRKLFLLPAIWLLAAATPALALSNEPYLNAGQVDLVHLLPPPPAANSPAQQRDLDAVLNVQKARNAEAARRAEDDAKVDIFRFADVLGPNFSEGKLPALVAFFGKVGRETNPPVTVMKDCWERRRPFVVSADIHPPGTMGQDAANRQGTPANAAPHDSGSPCRAVEPTPAYSYSYPSGHSTFGAMTAIILADMVPEKRAELFARGWEYGRNRIVGGVHFPTDVEAGRIEATLMVAFMMQNSGFKTDFAAVKSELRQALGLAP